MSFSHLLARTLRGGCPLLGLYVCPAYAQHPAYGGFRQTEVSKDEETGVEGWTVSEGHSRISFPVRRTVSPITVESRYDLETRVRESCSPISGNFAVGVTMGPILRVTKLVSGD